jgi:Ca-activated chloride channel family protein
MLARTSRSFLYPTPFAAALLGLLALAAGCSSQNDDARANAADAAATGGTSSEEGASTGYNGTGGTTGAPLVGSGGASSGAPIDSVVDAPPSSDEQLATNPFVIAEHDPLSTFAADVDTASYDIFRSNVQSGYLPETSTVRLEEFVNFFDYAYTAPDQDAETPFAIHLDASPSLVSRGTQMLRVGIQGKLPEAFVKKDTNLVFLIDTSGSMSGSLPLVKHTLIATLDVLDPADKVSIVTYAGSTSVVLTPTAVSERQTIESALTALESGGGTNGAGGLELAYQQAEAGFFEGGINHVVLCTDGDFNVGPSTTEELVQIIEQKRKTGITLTALGFGDNSNDAMMEAVSNKGNGVYGFIGDEAQADEYVAERLLSTIQFIAKDVKLQVEFNPAFVYAYRLLGYEDRAIADQDFRNDVIDAGEIGAGHRVTALYEIVPVGGSLPMIASAPAAEDGEAYTGAAEVSPDDFVLVKVRYKGVDATEADPALEVSQSLSPAAVADGFEATSSDFQWAAAIASFAEILKESPYADRDSLDAIQSVVDAQADKDAGRTTFAELFSDARILLNE